WILNRLNDVIKSVDENMDKYEFVNVGSELYNFIWDDFCSWYIELSKVHLNSEDLMEKTAAQETLVYVLNAIVKLLHPFMPFVTEEIYQSIPHQEESICIAKWPTVQEDFNNNSINDKFTYLFDIVKGIRNMRAQYTIKNSIEMAYSIQTKDNELSSLLEDLAPYIDKLCHAKCIGYNVETSTNVATEMIKGGHALIIELGDYVDMEAEKAKLNDELKKLEGEIKRCQGMLSNPNFTNKAPADKVDAEKKKLEDYQSKYDTIKQKIENM
ncbi:MAG: class I tRNA ligase family protein, partial [Coprobacillus sp.]